MTITSLGLDDYKYNLIMFVGLNYELLIKIKNSNRNYPEFWHKKIGICIPDFNAYDHDDMDDHLSHIS